jgi:hypothetical protein
VSNYQPRACIAHHILGGQGSVSPRSYIHMYDIGVIFRLSTTTNVGSFPNTLQVSLELGQAKKKKKKKEKREQQYETQRLACEYKGVWGIRNWDKGVYRGFMRGNQPPHPPPSCTAPHCVRFPLLSHNHAQITTPWQYMGEISHDSVGQGVTL